MKKKVYTRREFMQNTSAAAIAGALYLNLPAKGFAQTATKSRVVLIRDAAVIDANNKLNADLLRGMLDQAVSALTDQADAAAAWKQIITSGRCGGNQDQYLVAPGHSSRIRITY